MIRFLSAPVTFDKLPQVIEKAKFKYKIEVKVDFPLSIEYEGNSYYSTDKAGTNLVTGLPAAEYSDVDENKERRVWMQIDGTITPE